MTVIQTNFIKGRMNKSVDERLLPPGEYVDALNVRLGSTEDTEIGSVENSKGNSLIAELTYDGAALSGSEKCIGVLEDVLTILYIGLSMILPIHSLPLVKLI